MYLFSDLVVIMSFSQYSAERNCNSSTFCFYFYCYGHFFILRKQIWKSILNFISENYPHRYNRFTNYDITFMTVC